MRAGVAQAIHHCSQRAAFGKLLIEQPLMRERAGRPRDRVGGGHGRGACASRAPTTRPAPATSEAFELRRLANAVLKYWLNKRAPAHAAEALECFGGNGYVEESGMPRLYREVAPELDLGGLRQRPVPRRPARDGEEPRRRSRRSSPRSSEAAGADERLDLAAAELREELRDLDAIEARARRIVEWMALVLQGSLLVRFGDEAVADAFCASRLGGDAGRAFGTLPPGVDFAADRGAPRAS